MFPSLVDILEWICLPVRDKHISVLLAYYTYCTYIYLSASEWQWQQESQGCDMPEKLLKRFSHAFHGISHSSKIIGAYLTKIPKTNYELIICGVYTTEYTKYVQKQLNSRNYIWFHWQFVCKHTYSMFWFATEDADLKEGSDFLFSQPLDFKGTSPCADLTLWISCLQRQIWVGFIYINNEV